jgi:hypothetical protein
MEITILAGSTAKIPFPRNDRNRPDSGGFRQEYMEDCKELQSMDSILLFSEVCGFYTKSMESTC